MFRALSILFFSFIFLAMQGQYNYRVGLPESEATFGVVVSRFQSDSLPVDALSHFGIGFRTTAALSGNWYFRANGRFSTRGYNIPKISGKLRNRYVDAELNALREMLPGLYAEFGLAGHFLFDSEFRYRTPYTGFEQLSFTPDSWKSYIDGFIGLDIRMEERLALGARYYPSFTEKRQGSLLVQLSVSIDESFRTDVREVEKEYARDNIRDLRNGVLLVRIKHLERSVDALIKMGEPLRAEETRKKIEEQNKALIQAFNDEFKFCPVFFFNSEDSKEVIAGNVDGKIYNFKGESVQLDFPYSKIYFADTGPLAADTSTHYYNYELVNEGNFSVKRVKRAYAGQAMGFGALVIKDENFRNLDRPLPYYVKTWGHFFFLRKPDKFVALLNEKLFNYYHKVVR